MTPSISPAMSYPASYTWHVSRQTPIFPGIFTLPIIDFSSLNFEPTSLPLPAIVSRRIVVV